MTDIPTDEAYFRYQGGEIVTESHIRDAVNNGHKIRLIKYYRHITGLGLRDSKVALDNCCTTITNSMKEDAVVELFHEHMENVYNTLTKEEFMNLIGDAIDNMDTFRFGNMLDAVATLCNNIQNSGGLDAIAKERSKFLGRI